jgi:hypothetical protein
VVVEEAVGEEAGRERRGQSGCIGRVVFARIRVLWG